MSGNINTLFMEKGSGLNRNLGGLRKRFNFVLSIKLQEYVRERNIYFEHSFA